MEEAAHEFCGKNPGYTVVIVRDTYRVRVCDCEESWFEARGPLDDDATATVERGGGSRRARGSAELSLAAERSGCSITW